jgi:alkanesulfonate monooxygenase SsuD/methylene tetrahydromethanopterin reductase-like flavin-dependent oxidoreductase (luciferase family)
MKHKPQSAKEAMANWIVIDRVRNPAALKAWLDYRRHALGCTMMDVSALTVPHVHTPSTPEEAAAYATAIAITRNSIGWTSKRARLPSFRPATKGDDEAPAPRTGATLL